MKPLDTILQYASQIAYQTIGTVQPSPALGAIWTFNGLTLGKGAKLIHRHSSVEFEALKDAGRHPLHTRKESTLYITPLPYEADDMVQILVNSILEHQIGHLVVSCLNPSNQKKDVYDRLRKAGVKVKFSTQPEYSERLLRPFFCWIKNKRPYIILKYARGENGVMGDSRTQIWLTNAASKRLVHKWRAETGAILVGHSTMKVDNPKLNTRLWPGKSPLRIVIGNQVELHSRYHLFSGVLPTWVYAQKYSGIEIPKNVELKTIQHPKGVLLQVLQDLYQSNIQTLMVEGGPYTLQSFIDLGLWDEARIFTVKASPQGDIFAPEINHTPKETYQIGQDQLQVFVKT